MRKVAFIERPIDEILKLMIHGTSEGVFLYGYDCVQDSSAICDNWYMNISEAEEYCQDIYNVCEHNWIPITEPLGDCQHDFIHATIIKGKNSGNPEWGHLQTFENGRWIDQPEVGKLKNFNGLTVNERLYLSGLMQEFDLSKDNDKQKAMKILQGLQVDSESVSKIIG